jgi:hypothetical protein
MSSRTWVRSCKSNCQSLTKRVQPAAEAGVWCDVGGLRMYDPAGVIAVLVLEDAFEDDELLAAAVRVGGEMTVGGISDDRRCARHFIADAIEHAALDAGHWRRNPGEPRSMHGDATRKICIEFQQRLPASNGLTESAG